jgi:dephospho-CoA kinase
MHVVGLVGGIGSGKSEAARMLAAMGAVVIDADKIGHAVYEPGTPGFAAVVDAFGSAVVGDDGRIDRRALGPIVFGDAEALARLNGIVHPLIRAEIERRIAEERALGGAELVVVEAAILLEAGWRSLVDEVWVVRAPLAVIRERLATSRGLSAEEVDARVARQMSDAERCAAADVVVENAGTRDDLRERLSTTWGERVAR